MFQFRNHHRGRIPVPKEGFIPLTGMRDGQSGKIALVAGGKGVIDRLAALGIREGRTITRMGGMYLRGPVTIKIDKTQVAIGFGMAKRIFIEPEK